MFHDEDLNLSNAPPPTSSKSRVVNFSYFSLLKSNRSIKNPKTKLITFPWISRVTQSKFEANRSRDSLVMIGQTNRQKDEQRLQLSIYRIQMILLKS